MIKSNQYEIALRVAVDAPSLKDAYGNMYPKLMQLDLGFETYQAWKDGDAIDEEEFDEMLAEWHAAHAEGSGPPCVPTPECDRIKALRAQATTVHDFLVWLSNKGIVLAERDVEDGGRLLPAAYPMRKMVEDFFRVDSRKAEEERMQVLKELAKSYH